MSTTEVSNSVSNPAFLLPLRDITHLLHIILIRSRNSFGRHPIHQRLSAIRRRVERELMSSCIIVFSLVVGFFVAQIFYADSPSLYNLLTIPSLHSHSHFFVAPITQVILFLI